MEAIMDRIKKLLRLAGNNPSQAEAQAAAAKAQALMDQYKIDSAAINVDGGDTDTEVLGDEHHDPVELRERAVMWRAALLAGLARLNACRAILVRERAVRVGLRRRRRAPGGHTELCLVGSKRNVEYVRWLYLWIVPQVERLATKAAYGRGRRWATNYKFGVSDGLILRLEKQRQELLERLNRPGVSGTALAIFDKERAALEAFLAVRTPPKETRKVYPQSPDIGAQLAGRADSERVGLARPLASGQAEGRLLLPVASE